MFKKIIASTILLIGTISAEVWKDGEFLLWNYGKSYISPADFCFALRYENEKIGIPSCYEAGEWERDTTVAMYAKWLNTNLESRLVPEDLLPRNPHTIEKIRSLKDKSLLFNTVKNGKIWFLLFDETSIEPKKIASFSITQDSANVAKKIANDWFGSTPQRRLTDEERAKKQSEPDKYYAEQPMHDFWLGINAGHSRAPFKPKKNAKDSVSIWNFLEDSSPVYGAYIGGSLYDFIGFEFELRHSEHKPYTRYEFWLSLEFMTVFMPIPQIEIKPYTSASVIYSFFSAPKEEENQLKLESYYSGVALNIGLRAAFFKNYAINLRTGIANRGTAMKTEEVIGSSTTDVYIAAGLEYHFRWR